MADVSNMSIFNDFDEIITCSKDTFHGGYKVIFMVTIDSTTAYYHESTLSTGKNVLENDTET